MKHIWSILSKKSLIDSSTNLISIFEVVDEFKIDLTLPKNLNEVKKISIPIEFELTTLWYRDISTGEYPFNFRIEFYDPHDKKINTFENELVFPKDKKRLRSQSKIQGLPVNDSGVYKFILGFKDKKMKDFQNVAELPIDITLSIKVGEAINVLDTKKSS